MSRRDFELLADALARTRPDSRTLPDGTFTAEEQQWRIDRNEIAAALQVTNTRYNRDRFIRATEDES